MGVRTCQTHKRKVEPLKATVFPVQETDQRTRVLRGLAPESRESKSADSSESESGSSFFFFLHEFVPVARVRLVGDLTVATWLDCLGLLAPFLFMDQFAGISFWCNRA